MRKQVLVSVDRGETRVALMEATGAPAAAPNRGWTPAIANAQGTANVSNRRSALARGTINAS